MAGGCPIYTNINYVVHVHQFYPSHIASNTSGKVCAGCLALFCSAWWDRTLRDFYKTSGVEAHRAAIGGDVLNDSSFSTTSS